ncbi:hypothetical protein [Pseudovibrio brasiliensis]|uniref:Uncharacterized protein n=1 Tax=Pseudovibrio brasiliensis TaxID=1898042 RepID=A0ABX8AHH4_9HYPH|nr:hypothetical protein [Pseudovibrio brasiliensis]QUS54515.1 hypothetical protein KGB56_14055 [Pseudovibrio brasiliensis]
MQSLNFEKPTEFALQLLATTWQKFWWIRGFLAPLLLLPATSMLFGFEQRKITFVFHALVTGWNDLLGDLGTWLAARLPIPNVDAALINTITIASLFVIPIVIVFTTRVYRTHHYLFRLRKAALYKINKSYQSSTIKLVLAYLNYYFLLNLLLILHAIFLIGLISSPIHIHSILKGEQLGWVMIFNFVVYTSIALRHFMYPHYLRSIIIGFSTLISLELAYWYFELTHNEGAKSYLCSLANEPLKTCLLMQ